MNIYAFVQHETILKMFEQITKHISRPAIAIAIITGSVIFTSWSSVIASDDHDKVRNLRNQGEIIPLSDLIDKSGLTGVKILEAELEKEHGKLVYELEFLDADGHVYEQYFDAITGEPLSDRRRD